MTDYLSTRRTLEALLAKHEDDGLDAKRQHTYRWREADGREKVTVFDKFKSKRANRRTA